jgi:hypothetical protein
VLLIYILWIVLKAVGTEKATSRTLLEAIVQAPP